MKRLEKVRLEQAQGEKEKTEKMARERKEKHEEALNRIRQLGTERKLKAKLEAQQLREVNERKPLYRKYEERYQSEYIAKDLAEAKKALEDKRNFVNQVPGGGIAKI